LCAPRVDEASSAAAGKLITERQPERHIARLIDVERITVSEALNPPEVDSAPGDDEDDEDDDRPSDVHHRPQLPRRRVRKASGI
jgi:hypothetical protein